MAEVIAEIAAKPVEALASKAFKKIKFAATKDLESAIEQLGYIYCYIHYTLQNVDPFEERSDIERMEIMRLKLKRVELYGLFSKLAAKAGVQREVIGSRGFTAKVCTFLSSPKQTLSRFKYAAKVNDLMSELGSPESVNQMCKNLAIHSPRKQNPQTPSEDISPFPVTDVFIGRDTDKENIINLLCNYSVVAIVGVGGQGKTTLAQYACEDDRVKGSFDILLWVYLTPQSSIHEILEKIITSATGKKPTCYGSEQLHRQVFQAITGKKCLLVLDNVCYVEKLRHDSKELNAILERGGFWGNRGKLLITTRSKTAAKLMDSPKIYELHDLAEDDCWILLRHYAIKEEQEDNKESGVEEIGKEIAKMCPKVPLVLKIIGCNLAFKDYKSQWEAFRKEFDFDRTLYLSTQQETIKQTLRRCFDQLDDNNSKRCAASCSLFPKGHVYSKNYMVRNWIALDFVKPRDGMSLEDVGDAYVLELTQRGFFEEAGNFDVFKMHDVMHDLVRSIGKDEYQMIDSKTEYIFEEVSHVSLNLQDLNWNVLLSSISGKQQALESIILVSTASNNHVRGERLGSGIDELIPACQKLKVLEIYQQEIREVPKSIGELIFVRHLNLSHNYFCKLPNEITKMVNLLELDLSCCFNLQELPSKMGKLSNLLSLNLEWCTELKELPSDMRKLVKLRHLRIKQCYLLKCMPEGFGNLTELETLDMFIVGESSRSSRGLSKAKAGAKLKELGHLNHLKGDLCIKLTGASKDIVSEAGEAHLEKKTKLTKLEIIFEKKAEEDEKFLEGIQLWGENLEKVCILKYGGNRLPVWMTDDRFHKRFPKLHSFVLGRPSFTFSPIIPAFYDEDEFMSITVEGNEDDLVEWVPRYSRIKEHLKMGTVKLSFETRRRDGPRLADPRDLTLHKVCMRIDNELAPRSSCGLRRQPDFFLKSCFPNLTELELMDIPELEVLPEEFRDLSSLEDLTIEQCPKLKAIPDWIGTLSSLKTLLILNAPEVKVLPDSIGSLTSLRSFYLYDVQGLECLPRHLSNLPELCNFDIVGCSTELVKKCAKQMGEYWPYLQHLQSIRVRSSEGDELLHWRPTDYESCEEDEVSSATATALISQSSHNEATPLTLEAVPSHSKLLSLRNGLLLFFVVVVVVVISLSLF